MELCKTILKALLAAVITAALLIVIFSFIAYKNSDPLAIINILGRAVLIISAFVGGAFSRRGKGGIAFSLIFAAVYIFICFAVFLLCGEGEIFPVLLTYLGAAAAAVLGGIIFGGAKKRKPKGLKRYNKSKR